MHPEGRTKQEVMPQLIPSASLQGRAAIIHVWEQTQLGASHGQVPVMTWGCPEAWGRGEQRAGAHHQRVQQSCRVWFHHRNGSRLQAHRTEASHIPISDFLPSLLTFSQSWFQESCLPVCWAASLGWYRIKTLPKPATQIGLFSVGFGEFKKAFGDSAAESALVGYECDFCGQTWQKALMFNVPVS